MDLEKPPSDEGLDDPADPNDETAEDEGDSGDLDTSGETVFDYWNEDPDLDADDEEELSPEQLKAGMEALKAALKEDHPEWFQEGFKAEAQAPNPVKDAEEDGLDEQADKEEAAPPE